MEEETAGLGLAAARREIQSGCLSIVLSDLCKGTSPYTPLELKQAMHEDQTLTSLVVKKWAAPDLGQRTSGYSSFRDFLTPYIFNRPHLRVVRLEGDSQYYPPGTPDSGNMDYFYFRSFSSSVEAARLEYAVGGNTNINEVTMVHVRLFDRQFAYLCTEKRHYRLIMLQRVDLLSIHDEAPEIGMPELSFTTTVDHLVLVGIRPESPSSATALAQLSKCLKPKVFIVDQNVLSYVLPEIFCQCQTLVIHRSSSERPLPRQACVNILDSLATNTTLTNFRNNVNSTTFFSQEDTQRLNGYVARNRQLQRFMEHPRDFPEPMLATLLEQLQQCSSAQFQMVRAFATLGYFEQKKVRCRKRGREEDDRQQDGTRKAAQTEGAADD